MSAENEDPKEQHRPRFTAAEARERAEQARAKAEFILSRAYGLLREPKKEWQQIKAEETTIPNILLGYVAPLAAVPPICGLIGAYVFGLNYGGVDLRPALDDALIGALVSFVASVAMVFALGILINATVENFAGDRNDLAAQKVAAYAMTPAFLSGVFSLWPPLWWLSLIAIAASVFLLYRGLPALMKTPEDQALGYTATVAIAGMIAFVVLFSLSSCVTGAGGL
jgi:hypothetical protein